MTDRDDEIRRSDWALLLLGLVCFLGAVIGAWWVVASQP
jgi:heme A synthase